MSEGNVTKERPINQFGDHKDTTDMSCKDWNERWKKEQTQFHMSIVHPMLLKHINRLTDGKSNLRIFVPLCGKSMDVKWLSDQGHEIVGCDCSEAGCKEIFERDNIPYTSEYRHSVQSTLLKATDRKLSLYVGDFFHLQKKEIGEFDCVWDRGSLVAIPVKRRQEYADILVSVMANETKYLLDCFLVDNVIFGGPPFNCNEKNVKEYFGSQCVVEKIDQRDALTKWQTETWKVKSFLEELYLIRIK
ncbi:probable thiopurine S-methyltransferase [Pecten maximus]|uniref:probable thiopurine S-methyltransferase n=1 Tax=Pecten maximus TaxID=6579 RepID=UPI0014583B51|nr:probable thiopurine S-methyltransferase [Pecten maximus]XP_033736867.1 probable thiopurine S-methyltransferase [Pecten maximus]XP_033736868.1 probable thiopurine S-methyltransferase [Pecten maximus]